MSDTCTNMKTQWVPGQNIINDDHDGVVCDAGDGGSGGDNDNDSHYYDC